MRGVSTKTPERVAEAQRLRDEGLSYAQIGERLGLHGQSIYSWLTGNSSTERVQRYRADAAKRERDREVSRRWKREKLGQPGLPKRDAA